MRHAIFTFFLPLLLTGCGEELMTPDAGVSAPIVEGYLLEGDTSITVKVYGMEAYRNGDTVSMPIAGLLLKVNGQELAETAAGTYSLSLGGDTVCALQTYALSFDYLGKTVSASATIPRRVDSLQADPETLVRSASSLWPWGGADSDDAQIRLSWDDPEQSYYQLYIESPASQDMQGMGGNMHFRRQVMQPFRGSSYAASSRELMATGYYRIYVYRVEKSYVDLYERLSSTDLANPASAIQNAFGVFTGMSVAKIRVRVVEN
ncbi:MAG: DUF4249 family protein [Prevotellaceae bacterium]|jgi:hypothetical protein|nr:DUF4249 family protein [Prevotellaceae bacterium]